MAKKKVVKKKAAAKPAPTKPVMRQRSQLGEILLLGVTVLAVVGFMNYALHGLIKNAVAWTAVSGLQAIVSAWAGHYFFPRIFGNKELEQFQGACFRNIANIMTAGDPTVAKDRVMVSITNTIRDIPHKTLSKFLLQEHAAMAVIFSDDVSSIERDQFMSRAQAEVASVIGVELKETPRLT